MTLSPRLNGEIETMKDDIVGRVGFVLKWCPESYNVNLMRDGGDLYQRELVPILRLKRTSVRIGSLLVVQLVKKEVTETLSKCHSFNA